MERVYEITQGKGVDYVYDTGDVHYLPLFANKYLPDAFYIIAFYISINKFLFYYVYIVSAENCEKLGIPALAFGGQLISIAGTPTIAPEHNFFSVCIHIPLFIYPTLLIYLSSSISIQLFTLISSNIIHQQTRERANIHTIEGSISS